MFLWVRFDFSTHPLAKKFELKRLAHALWTLWTRKPFLCLAAPGEMFAPTQEVKERDAWQCFRLCFAAIPSEEVESISKRFVQGAQAFWRIKSQDKIEELLSESERDDGPWVLQGSEGVAQLQGFGFC
jgi:DNA-binding transcriptional MocR family regulator